MEILSFVFDDVGLFNVIIGSYLNKNSCVVGVLNLPAYF